MFRTFIILSLCAGSFACEKATPTPSKTVAAKTVEAAEKVEPVKPAPPAAPVERTLAVEGMSCKGCAATVRTALMSVEGVKDAKGVFADGQATIQCDPSVSADKLIQTVENWELGGVKQSYKAREILQ